MANFTVTVGRIYWRPVRDIIKHAAFVDDSIKYLETGGVITRKFSVRGDDEAIRRLFERLQEFTAANK